MTYLESGFKQVIGMLEYLYMKSGIEDVMPLTKQEKALEAYKQGDIEKAITYFEECLEAHGIYGLSAEVRANCANHLSVIYNGKDEDNQQLYYLIYAAETDINVMYQKNLAAYYFNNKDYVSAYHQAKKCISMNANDDLILEAAKDNCASMVGVLEHSAFADDSDSEL